MSRYDDIINLPHHVSKIHKPMSMQSRAAQFAPFSALTGYGEAVKETARLTDEQIIIDDGLKEMLNDKLQYLLGRIRIKPQATFTYFVPDKKKIGGSYKTITNKVKKIDLYNQFIILVDNTKIPINDIINISGDIFSNENMVQII